MESKKDKTGLVALIGRTNVGKSTLLNQLIKQKIAITSRKPQTTRQKLLGINTKSEIQIIYLDTPGFHLGFKRALNKYMNNLAISSIHEVDIILFVIEALRFRNEDEFLLKQFKNKKNVILVINKIDKLSNKKDLLPFIEELSFKHRFQEIIPISATRNLNIVNIEKSISSRLPLGRHLFPKDQIADKTERFLASEIIREKCITRVGDEIPYRLAVFIDNFQEQKEIITISAILFVEKNTQKGIVIGNKGQKLKSIGIAARKDLEVLLDKKVMLKLWVKVKKNWTDDQEAMNSVGYKLG